MPNASQALLDELRRNNRIAENDTRVNQDMIDAMFHGGQFAVDPVSQDSLAGQMPGSGASDFSGLDGLRFFDRSGDVAFQGDELSGQAQDIQSARNRRQDLGNRQTTSDGGWASPDATREVRQGRSGTRTELDPNHPDVEEVQLGRGQTELRYTGDHGGAGGGNRRDISGRANALTDADRAIHDAEAAFNQQRDDLLQQADRRNLFEGFQEVDGIGDDIHERQREAYLDYANPELDRQFDTMGDELVFALSRGGQLQSSVAAQRHGDLERQYSDERDQIAARGDRRVSDSRNQLAQEHSRLSDLAEQGTDVASLANEFGQATDALSQVQDFDPLGEVFADVVGGIGQGAQSFRDGRARQRARNAYSSDPSDGGNSSRVIR